MLFKVSSRFLGLSWHSHTWMTCQPIRRHTAELEAFGKVALAVALNLGLPEAGTGLGKDEVTAAFMAVPEAAVYKDDGAILAKHNVGRTGQAADVDAKT